MFYEERPYQDDAVGTIVSYAEKHPTGRLLVVLPPGAGKTLIVSRATLNLRRRFQQALVLGHRREMVLHHYKCLLDCKAPRKDVGLFLAKSRLNPSAPIQVASVATVARRLQKDVVPAELLVTDEAHRDASPSRRQLRRAYPKAFQLGITATPHRLDGEDLREDFDEMLVVSSISELILNGYISAPKVFTVPHDLLPEMETVEVVKGKDFNDQTLEWMVNKRALIGGIVDHWTRMAEGRKTVCFAASVEHSKHIVRMFEEKGIQAKHLDDSTPMGERAKILECLDDPENELKVVSCVDVLAEGWDSLRCKCVILARPTLSLVLHIQQTGRPLRPWNHVVPLILDHAGNTIRHGLPQMERDWTLGSTNKRSGKEAPAKICFECLAVVAAGCNACPECGSSFPKPPAVLEEKPGELVEAVLEDQEVEFQRIRAFAARKGFSEEWVQRVIQAKFSQRDSLTGWFVPDGNGVLHNPFA